MYNGKIEWAKQSIEGQFTENEIKALLIENGKPEQVRIFVDRNLVWEVKRTPTTVSFAECLNVL